VIRLLRVFTPAQAVRLLILRQAYRRGVLCEFARVSETEPWSCPRDAAYVGPPSTRVEGER
jgi:hypothetical protein